MGLARELCSDGEARKGLLCGMRQLIRAVGVTLGPSGRSVMLGQAFAPPHVVLDGVEVAKTITLEPPLENTGARYLCAVVEQMEEEVGDGSVTAALLAYSMIQEGERLLAAGADPIALQRGIAVATDAAVSGMLREAQLPLGETQITQVAATAAKSKTLGNVVAEAIAQVGQNGLVTIRESPTTHTYVEYTHGYQFDQGFLSPYFITDPKNSSTVLERPYLLLCRQELQSVREIIPLLDALREEQANLLVIAEDISEEALSTFVLNHHRGRLKVCCVRAPGLGVLRRETLEDLAALTDGNVFGGEAGYQLKQAVPALLGRAWQVKVDKTHTTVLADRKMPMSLERRICQLNRQLAQAANPYEGEQLQDRISKLSSGAAIVRVGAVSSFERQEQRVFIKKGLCAARSCMEEGILPGGGAAYLHQYSTVDKAVRGLPKEEQLGGEIVLRALFAPAVKIMENAGRHDPLSLCARIREGENTVGIDVLQGTFSNCLENGILDSAKVARVALQKASSAARTFLTSHATVLLSTTETVTHPDPDTYTVDPEQLY